MGREQETAKNLRRAENGEPRIFRRICLRCDRPVRGYGFRTVYGILVRADGRRIPACGAPLHDRCPPPEAGPRVAPHDAAGLGESNFARLSRTVAPGIDLKRSGRYAARHNKKRLGTYATIDEAQAARAAYLARQRVKTHNARTSNRQLAAGQLAARRTAARRFAARQVTAVSRARRSH